MKIINTVRSNSKSNFAVDSLLMAYDLSSHGIALMFSRGITKNTDKTNIDKLIADKITNIKWQDTEPKSTQTH